MKKVLMGVGLLVLVGCGEGNSGSVSVGVPEVINYPSLPPPPPRQKAIPFDLAANNLGEKFTGHDCREVARALRAKGVLKDQYESTKEFNDRIAKLKEQPLYDDVKLSSQFAFVDNRKWPGIYDADKQVIDFDASHIGYNVAFGESHPMLTAYKRDKNERTYLGKNAFGATADVKYQEEEVCVVTMGNLRFEGLDKLNFKIKATPNQARALSGNIGTAFVGVLMPPFIKDYREYQKPKISSPYEVITEGEDVRLRLQHVLVFDRTTGEVLGRRTFK